MSGLGKRKEILWEWRGVEGTGGGRGEKIGKNREGKRGKFCAVPRKEEGDNGRERGGG